MSQSGNCKPWSLVLPFPKPNENHVPSFSQWLELGIFGDILHFQPAEWANIGTMNSDVLAMDDACSGVLTDAPPSGPLAQPAIKGSFNIQPSAVIRKNGDLISMTSLYIDIYSLLILAIYRYIHIPYPYIFGYIHIL